MKNQWTLLAACLFALAIALVVFHHDNPPAASPAAALPQRSAAKPTSAARPALAPGQPRAQAPTPRDTRASDQPALNGRDRSLTRNAAASADSAGHETAARAELAQRAQLVERDANHELARLIPLLELSPDQQQRVFQALARTSQNFVPGMLVDGTPLKSSTATPQQTLLAELTDAQITAYLADSNERSAWWSEYISGITSQLDSGTPAVGGTSVGVAAVQPVDTTTPVETAPATKDAHAITEGE